MRTKHGDSSKQAQILQHRTALDKDEFEAAV